MSSGRDVRISSATSTSDTKDSGTQANPAASTDEEEVPSDVLPDFSQPFLFSDVILKVEEETLHSHRAILSMWSPVFRAMFSNKCKESTTNTILLSEDKRSEICELLKYFYTPAGRDMDSEMALRLLPVIHRYQIDTLLETAERRLTSSLADHNVIAYMQLAEHYNLTSLQNATLDRCARLEIVKLSNEVTEASLSPQMQLDIFKRRAIFLEQCVNDIQRSFVQSCVKVESKLERVPANHCSTHHRPLTKTDEDGQCAECVDSLKNHISELCKRALHKTTIIICKEGN